MTRPSWLPAWLLWTDGTRDAADVTASAVERGHVTLTGLGVHAVRFERAGELEGKPAFREVRE